MKHLKPFNESNFTLEQRLEHLYGKEVGIIQQMLLFP